MKTQDKTERNWRVVSKTSVYSKKCGMKQVNITLIADVTYQECVDYLSKQYPKNKLVDNKMTVLGFLHPSYITVKYLKTSKK